MSHEIEQTLLESFISATLDAMRMEVVSIPPDRGQYDELMEDLKSGKVRVPHIFEDA